jgi:hypothetical protein
MLLLSARHRKGEVAEVAGSRRASASAVGSRAIVSLHRAARRYREFE